MHTRTLARLICATLPFLLSGTSALAQAPPPSPPELELSQHARLQLEAVFAEKASRTPAQRKLSTNLVYEVRSQKGDVEMLQVPRWGASLLRVGGLRVDVEITAEVTPGLLEEIEQRGGEVVSVFPHYRAVRARVPFAALEPIAEGPDVSWIREYIPPVTNKVNTSQGDIAHRANVARSVFGVNGSGVKVGVMSDSVDHLALAQSTGDLPAVTVLPGQSGVPASGEGTAMLEIVHDLAPGAQLYFATASGGEAAMAANIQALAAAGCKVIVDDIFYLGAPVFQDGVVAQAVEQAASQGVFYFSAAANSGNLSSNRSGTWEGDFVSGATVPDGTVHSFGPSVYNQLTEASPNPIVLQWSDAWGSSSNDYDLCALSQDGTTVLHCSADSQDGAGLPIEAVPAVASGSRLVVINYLGGASARYLHLKTNRGRLQYGTSGETSGHSAAASGFSIAAVNVATAAGGPFLGGAANPVESFSSDGPRRIFYAANGTPITPGNFLGTGGTVRQKPDLAAADGVATTNPNPGLGQFFGTSAAAPHAAAIAALMVAARPSATLTQVRQALQATALDIMAPGVDRDSGYGIIDAVEAVEAITGAGSPGPCVRDSRTACLLNNRFEVRVSFNTGTQGGDAQVMSFSGARTESDQSVFFYFFDNVNFEMGVKMVNACVAPFNRFWAFVSGLTNVGYQVTVRDSVTGTTRSYSNPLGSYPQTVGDTSAMNCLLSGPVDGGMPDIEFVPVSDLEISSSEDALEVRRLGSPVAEAGVSELVGLVATRDAAASSSSESLIGADLDEATTADHATTDYGLDILGYWEWSIESGQVHMRADNVKNSRPTSTGPIALGLWASPQPVTGGQTSGSYLGSCTYPALAPGATYASLVCDTAYSPPASGCYYVTILLLEYIDGAWYYMDWVGDATQRGLNGGTCGQTGACVRNASTACLLDGRFEVKVTYQTQSTGGNAGVMSFSGQRTESDQSVFYYFFDNANFEMGVKMVNACVPPFNRFWAFVSGLTNQGYAVSIRDTLTGQSRSYSNQLGSYPSTVGDTNAFICP